METIIGIDQSLTSTGVSVLKEEEIFYSNVIKTAELRGIERLDYICKFLANVVEEHTSQGEEIIVVREGYSYGSLLDTNSIFELGELGGVIDMLFYCNKNSIWSDRNIYMYIIPPSTWKLMIFGDGSVKKDTSYLLKVQELTGKRFIDDNIADSYMLAKSIKSIMGVDISSLNENQKYSLISPKLRKKNKITKTNIKKIDNKLLFELINITISGLRRM
ncbi:MAG: hypothetical protein M0P71_01275 [Melioribacteraceae bacterium]|nr:hypothetical protein [Melioribacteraceae bacterium]